MTIEDVEKILDETQESVEYQRVRSHLLKKKISFTFKTCRTTNPFLCVYLSITC